MSPRRLIDQIRCLLEILNDLRSEVPAEVAEAAKITKNKDSILNDAKVEAERMLELAKSKAEEYINEDELVIKANERADEVLKNASEESVQIREGARDYADSLLENTQVNLSEIIKMLNENRQELRCGGFTRQASRPRYAQQDIAFRW